MNLVSISYPTSNSILIKVEMGFYVFTCLVARLLLSSRKSSQSPFRILIYHLSAYYRRPYAPVLRAILASPPLNDSESHALPNPISLPCHAVLNVHFFFVLLI